MTFQRGRIAALSATSAIVAAGSAFAIAPPPIAPVAQAVTFSVHLPLTNTAALKTFLAGLQTPGSASYQKFLTPAQFNAQFGPTPAAVTAATQALTAAGLHVVSTSGRAIIVTGTVGQANTLFHVTLRNLASKTAPTRAVSITPPILPASSALAGAVVHAFAPVPSPQPRAQIVPVSASRRGPTGGYYYDDLKEAYDYPAYNTPLPGGQSLDGTGVSVAILGEALPLNSDVKAMFNNESFTATTGKPDPQFAVLETEGGGYAYGGVGSGATDEASLDVQQVLGGAPGASVTYLNTLDFADTYYYDIVQTNAYDIVSTSYGGCELFYTAAYNNGIDFTFLLGDDEYTFEQGAAQGITFIFSSGDSGGLSCPSSSYFAINSKGATFLPGLEANADSPSVTAVGGTNLVTTTPPVPYSGNPTVPEPSNYVSENAYGDAEVPYDPYNVGVPVSGGYWGATGGVSQVFAKPDYQNLVNSGSPVARTVPDIGMQVGGCPGGISVIPCGTPRSSVRVFIGGVSYGFIGTSVAAPEFAGALAVALQNARIVGGISLTGGRAGNVNPYLYAQAQTQITAGGANAPANLQFYHMNISGFDGYYSTTPSTGYNYITGNGTPDVRLLFGMQAYAPAGDPQTPSNP